MDGVSEQYQSIVQLIHNGIQEGADAVAVMANTAAMLHQMWPEWTWVGFYRVGQLGHHLSLGPFSGPPAPLSIAWGEGVIGSCAQERAVQIVGSVRRFPGYIPGVPETRSEVALPVIQHNHVFAVLDCQAAAEDAIDFADVEWLGQIAALFS